MAKKARKAQRRRRQQRSRNRAVSSLDKMHQALGEFLTEMGRVEFRMLLYIDIINEAPLEHLFDEYDGEPFGNKIKIFIKWCEFGSAPENQKSALKQTYKDLAELLGKRNFVVHGETWEGAFKGKPYQPYRVGLVEGNLEYLDEFDRSQHGPNVFDTQQVREATALCVKISSRLSSMRTDVAASAIPQEKEPGAN